MKNVRTICFAAVVLFMGAYPASGTIYFNDGQTHNISYRVNDSIYVDSRTPNMYTTVNCLDGANMIGYYLCGYEQSRINIRGGSLYYIYSSNSSRVNISGGSTWRLYSYDSSQINVSGGKITELDSRNSSQADISGGDIVELESFYSSRVNISGGSTDRLYSHDSSRIDITGGEVVLLGSYNSSQLNISGGEIANWFSRGGLHSHDSSQVNISGGSIGILYSSDISQINISGGSLGSFNLYDQSTMKIFGSNFAVDGKIVGYGELISILGGLPTDEPLRVLTGTLLSGELINNGFRIGQNARIILIPEPASAILMSVGATILTLRRKKR